MAPPAWKRRIADRQDRRNSAAEAHQGHGLFTRPQQPEWNDLALLWFDCVSRLRSPATEEDSDERHHLSGRAYCGDHVHPVASWPALKEADMTDTVYRDAADAGPVPTPGGPLSYIHWGP